VLVGPTAIGKTALSFTLVKEFNCEIVSMDSMQVYRYMDIGTAKPDQEEMDNVVHHLINIVDPDDQYDAARFVQDALAAIIKIGKKKKTVLLTGGTGMYLQALVHGLFHNLPAEQHIRNQLYEELSQKGHIALHKRLAAIDPVTAARIHPNDRQRVVRGLEIYLVTGRTWSDHLAEQKEQGRGVQFSQIYQVALNCPRDALYKRIARRTQIMLDQGLIEEVENLIKQGYPPELSSMQSIGYRHANMYIKGTWSYEEMKDVLIRDTRRYAKRQMTWFTKNKSLHWYERTETQSIIDAIERKINKGKTVQY